jgi:hypothetical protein
MRLNFRGHVSAVALAVLLAGGMTPCALRAQCTQGTGGAAKNALDASGNQAVGNSNVSKSRSSAVCAEANVKPESHETAHAQTPPSPGMVWVNTSSKVYHKAGSRWYGKTKDGKWMTETDAQKAGYKASKR